MENFLELLKRRRSSRVFTGEPVDKDMVCNIMKAALMSPSGHRINPWEFIMVEDKNVLKALSVSKEHGASLLEGAAMAVVVIADTGKTDVWIEDCSIAT
ncbi:MAG: nitroreductase family protein, partial [Bacteroidaceae bacterium]|nr:nitroreductase family protein [Bacteroidaceae bacterium]